MKKIVDDLNPGDHVDLEDDSIADPGPHGPQGSPFQFEYCVVEEVEHGPDGEVVVHFDGYTYAFPSGHAVDVNDRVVPLG